MNRLQRRYARKVINNAEYNFHRMNKMNNEIIYWTQLAQSANCTLRRNTCYEMAKIYSRRYNYYLNYNAMDNTYVRVNWPESRDWFGNNECIVAGLTEIGEESCVVFVPTELYNEAQRKKGSNITGGAHQSQAGLQHQPSTGLA